MVENCATIKYHKRILSGVFPFINEILTDVEFAPSIVTDPPPTKLDSNDKDKETCNPESCNEDLLLRSGTRTEEEAQATMIEVQENDTNSPWAVVLNYLEERGVELLKCMVMVTAYYMPSVQASKKNHLPMCQVMNSVLSYGISK